MRYVVLSPDGKLICFDHDSQVTSYCMEKENNYLDEYCKDQQLEYENMTPVEIGYAYATIGAEKGGCKIFNTQDVINVMREYEVDNELVTGINEMFNNRRLNQEMECPSYLEDVLSQMTPMDVAEMIGEPYTCQNIDGPNDEGMPWGI